MCPSSRWENRVLGRLETYPKLRAKIHLCSRLFLLLCPWKKDNNPQWTKLKERKVSLQLQAPHNSKNTVFPPATLWLTQSISLFTLQMHLLEPVGISQGHTWQVFLLGVFSRRSCMGHGPKISFRGFAKVHSSSLNRKPHTLVIDFSSQLKVSYVFLP